MSHPYWGALDTFVIILDNDNEWADMGLENKTPDKGGSFLNETKADVLLHPVRLRIVQALLPRRQLTAQEIGRHLGDVPQATLYRHLNKLLDGGIIEIVHESRSAVQSSESMR